MRFGRRTAGRGKPPARTSRGPPHHPPPNGHHSMQPAPYYQPVGASHEKKKSRGCSPLLIWLAVLSFLTILVMGVFPIIGCMTNKAGLDSLYLVQLRQNTSQDIEFGIGYFGGCITTTETSSSSSDSNSNSTQTHCITNLRTKSAPDIAELYTENLPSQSLPQLTQFLNTTIPLIQDLQDSVFYYQLPVLHYALLILSSLILWVALMSSSQKRRYKFTLFLAAVFSAIALGLALLMGVGSLQAMNALEVLASESGSGINSGNDSSDDDNNLVLDIGNGITFHGAHRLANVQYAQAAVVGLFYILLGLMFVRRKEEGIRAVAFVPSMPRFRRR